MGFGRYRSSKLDPKHTSKLCKSYLERKQSAGIMSVMEWPPNHPTSTQQREGKGREVVCGQVWWPILGICPLHLTHPSAHSQQWTHTWSSGQPYCGARGAVGGSVPCSRVSPQSWYWRWREHLLFTPPTDNPCRTWESNRQPLGYKSNSLTIRPRLPKATRNWTVVSVRSVQPVWIIFGQSFRRLDVIYQVNVWINWQLRCPDYAEL